MGNSVRLRALALVSTGLLGLVSLGGVAVADPRPDHTDQGKHLGQEKDPRHGHDQGDKTKGHQAGKGTKGNHAGQAHAPGQQGAHDAAAAAGAAHGDPNGNNGTVKIAGPADEIGHPSNNPHPGCTFYVEWFGFDEGADVVSTVTFTPQAPTSDTVVGGTSPAQVFVGGDPAGGGTDLDGRQAYTLTFQGEPHPQQGYHLKLTVATPHSLGNDTKTKVFWVEPCEAGDVGAVGATTSGTGGRGVDSGTVGIGTLGTGGRDTGETADQGVLGETFTADSTGEAPAVSAGDDAAVPTAVDAGKDSLLPQWARSPLPLTLVSFALVLAGVGIVLRNRSRA